MMTAEQLKASILQLAMQGKLVEQKSGEGTGEELYKEIQVEKKRLIKEGKIKKQKPLPEVSEDEIPFEIPDSWLWVRVTDICTKLVDGDHNPPKGISGTSEFIMASSRNINQDRLIDLDQVRYLDKDTFLKENERTMASKGDIFFTSVGSLGRSCVYDGSLNICFQRSVSVMTTLIFNHYLKRCFDSGYFQNKVNREATGTAQKGFYLNQLAAALIPLPPLAEQKRIVAKIEELMPFVEQYAAASTKLNTLNAMFPEMMKKSILQEAVQGKLVPQDPSDEPASVLLKKIAEEKKRLIKEGKIKKQKPLPVITEDEIPFDIPESWEWVKLGNIIDLLSGTDFKPSEYSDVSGKTVYITGASCLSENGVISQRWTDTPRNIAHKGDLLLVCKGSGYGKTVICDVDEAHIARQIMAIRDLGLLDLNYVRFFLQSKLTYIKKSGQGVIPGIDRGTILNMAFPLPPIAEQRRIACFTSNMLKTIESLGKELE